jgi:hypothetical protein
VHFVHFAALDLAKWTLCPYSVHFVHLTDENLAKWTKCSLPVPPLNAAVDGRRRRAQLRIDEWRATTRQRPSCRFHTSVSRNAFERFV